MKSLFIIICMILAVDLSAQSAKVKKAAAEKKATAERGRSFGGQRIVDDDENDKAGVNNKIPAEVNSTDRQSDSARAVSTVPAAIQPSTSESGSPAILSENNGRGRDGTGNVQRSTPNIAGSPVRGNMNLDKRNRGEKNVNTDSLNVREQEQQPRQETSKRRQESGKQLKEQQGAEKESLRSDEKKKEKVKGKNRRNKDRDSGK